MPAFRGKQLRDHLYGARPARDVDDLTTLPKVARESLRSEGVTVGRSRVHHVAAATDGVAKLLLRLDDNRVVETVGIPATEMGRTDSPRASPRRWVARCDARSAPRVRGFRA